MESARRLECYDAIFDRFGTERVAVTAMPETYRARRALRDTGLALGIAPADVDRIAKSFPHLRAIDITSALAELPELRQLAAEAERYGPLWELAEGLDSLVHGMAMHPCGVVISDATLLDRLPVQPTPQGDYPMAMAAKEEIEALGNIKLDVLGVRMQSAMAHAVTEIERATGDRIDLDDPRQVPLDDVFAFKIIQESQTIGLFQLESPGQQDLLSRLQPRDPQDVIADISLFRPGPVAGGMPERYIAARHGGTPAYAHPDLEPVLADTYGVTIWHEQIIETLSVLTGCDRALAEVARRALGDKDRLPRLKDWFHRQACARGYTAAVRDEVWKTVEAFGAYGFCRAHAVAFAVPALQSAWLKAHFPAFLLAGLLEHDPGMWPKRVIVADARRRGVPVLPVDVNHSRTKHTVERAEGDRWGVRLALSAVRGISEEECARIAEGQPYGSLSDFWQRARPSRPVAERLAEIGALNVPARRPSHPARPAAADRRTPPAVPCPVRGQGPAALRTTGAVGGAEPSGLPEMTGREALSAELSTLGIDVSRHLMDHHHRLLREIGATDAAHLAGLRGRSAGPRRRCTGLDSDPADRQRQAHHLRHPGGRLRPGRPGLLRGLPPGLRAHRLPQRAAAGPRHGPGARHPPHGRRHHGLGPGRDRRRPPRPRPGSRSRPARRPATRNRPPRSRSAPWSNGTTGARLHPYADLKPAGSRSADLRRLGYTSPGSAG